MSESESHRVLVVDDEPDITALVAYHLAKAGYRVITAANGRDAVRTAREERPDLVVLDTAAHRLTLDGTEVVLTATEFKLLRTLLEREGRVQSRAQLLETVWHAQPDIRTRTVDMHLQRLRRKLGPMGARIETVRGVGYRFCRGALSAAAGPARATPRSRW